MKIDRYLISQIQQTLLPGKVTVLYGPRQVGKTTLLMELFQRTNRRALLVNADELVYREALASQNRGVLQDLIGDHDLLMIDEAQRVENIGLNLKILVDNNPQVAFLATGSASFELANQISEPLTGRTITHHLYPVSYEEIQAAFGKFEARTQLERWLIFGAYPEIVTTENSALRERLLGELVGAYLYRDILELEGLRKADKMVDILRLLAFQIGNEVSIAELTANLALNRNTVERYLDLLEKVFVIYRVRGFSRNLRKEISKNPRYFFYDNGVRNALIQNFNPLHLRNDTSKLWENFICMERRKFNASRQKMVNSYFWRTYDQKEIDLIEESGGAISGFEIKYSGRMGAATRKTFQEAYPGSDLKTINREHFEEFISQS